jgi:DNA-binding NtrC family response regulator
MQWIQNFDWPGNVRQLKNSLEAAVVLCRNNTLQVSDLQLDQMSIPQETAKPGETQGRFSLEHSEKEAIIRALQKTNGVQKSAAELLNISRRSIHYKLKKYNITPNDYK